MMTTFFVYFRAATGHVFTISWQCVNTTTCNRKFCVTHTLTILLFY